MTHFPNRCYASETNYYAHANAAAPTVSGNAVCPRCGKPVKLRTGRMGTQQLNQIPTHNRPKKEAK